MLISKRKKGIYKEIMDKMIGKKGVLQLGLAEYMLVTKDFTYLYEEMYSFYRNFEKTLNYIKNKLEYDEEFKKYAYKRVKQWVLKQRAIRSEVLRMKDNGELNY